MKLIIAILVCLPMLASAQARQLCPSANLVDKKLIDGGFSRHVLLVAQDNRSAYQVYTGPQGWAVVVVYASGCARQLERGTTWLLPEQAPAFD